MKIDGWHVDGFGILCDYRVENLPEGIVLLVGPNEAGKTTLLRFVTTVLFAGRGQLPCPPLRGGRHGGRLMLQGPGGIFTIERYAERRGNRFQFGLPSGGAGTDEDLRLLLGGADAKLFESVFAFSLLELQALRTLDEEGIRDRIYSAGIAGAGRSARQVIQTLEEKGNVLLRQRVGHLFDLAARLNELDDARRRIEAQAGAYLELVDREKSLRDQISDFRRRIDELRDRKLKYEGLMAVWSAWCDLCQARQQLEQGEEIDSFPPDAEARFKRSIEKLEAARVSEVEAANNLSLARDDRNELAGRLDDRLVDARSALETAAGEAALQAERIRQRSASAAALRGFEDELGHQIADLGPGWDIAKLRAFDVSLPTRQDVRQWESTLSEAERNLREAERAHLTASGEEHDVEDRRNRTIEARDQAQHPDEAGLSSSEENIARIRAAKQQLELDETRLDLLKGSLEATEREIRDVESRLSNTLPVWLPRALLTGSVGIALIGIWRFTTGDVFGGAALLLLCAVFAGTALLSRSAIRAAGQQRQALPQLRAAQQQRLKEITETEDRISRLREEAGAASLNLGVDISSGFLAVEQKANLIAAERRQLAEWKELDRRVAEIEQALADACNQVERAAGELRRARDEQSRLLDEWTQWKNRRQVNLLAAPRDVIDFFDKIRKAREHLALRDQAVEDHARIESEIERWEVAAQRAVQQASDESEARMAGETLIAAVRRLWQQANEDAQRRVELQNLDRTIVRLEAANEGAQNTVREAVEAHRRLLAEAGVDNDDEFRRRYQLFVARAEYRRIIADSERHIESRFGRGAEAEASRAALASGDRASWERAVVTMEADIPRLESERDQLIAACADVERGRRTLESASDLAANEAEFQAVLEQFAAGVRQWRVLNLAKGLVERALSVYANEKQPQVLADASRFFQIATAGVYVRVLQDEEGKIVVIDRDNRRKKPEQELSRGTAELLYLCLRLGLACVFARQPVGMPVAMPLIMDDVLVNFDPERARLMAGVLATLASQEDGPRQVLLFTCHPETVEVMRAASPACRLIELDRFGIPKSMAAAG